MNKEQKQEVIESLKTKFSQYSNFYITDTEKLSVAQITNLRRHCFDKQVEMKVAKNTLIKKALESLGGEKYSGVYDSLHKVTALMFSDSPKEPALIISSFRKSLNGERPLLKAAFLNGDVFVGNDQLLALTKIKTKNELIGEVIGLLMSPIQRVIGALQNRTETAEKVEAEAPKAKVATEGSETAATKIEAAPALEAKVQDTAAPKVEEKAAVAEPVAATAGSETATSKAEAAPAVEAKVPDTVAPKVEEKTDVAKPEAGAAEVPPEA